MQILNPLNPVCLLRSPLPTSRLLYAAITAVTYTIETTHDFRYLDLAYPR